MHEHVSKCIERHGKHSIMQSGKGKGTHVATRHPEMPPKWLHLNKASWASDVTTQGQAHGGRQTWHSLELERLTQA